MGKIVKEHVSKAKTLDMIDAAYEKLSQCHGKVPHFTTYIYKKDRELVKRIENTIRKAQIELTKLQKRTVLHGREIKRKTKQKSDYDIALAKRKRALRKAGVDVYDTQELQKKFKVEAFAAPFVVVKRKSDGIRGTLEFVSRPRVYFNFIPDSRR